MSDCPLCGREIIQAAIAENLDFIARLERELEAALAERDRLTDLIAREYRSKHPSPARLR